MGISSCCQSNETVSKVQEVDLDLNRPQYLSPKEIESPKLLYKSLDPIDFKSNNDIEKDDKPEET